MKMYRYVDIQYAPPVDEFDNPYGSGELKVVLLTFDVIKETAKGVWIMDHYGIGKKKFVLLSARKKFACVSEADAKTSFIARKRRQCSIYAARLRQAQRAIEICQRGSDYSLRLAAA